jgi:signal peptidase I
VSSCESHDAVSDVLAPAPAGDQVHSPGEAEGAPPTARRHGRAGLALAFLLPLMALFGARAFVAEPFHIPSSSMSPTLDAGEHVLANKLAYRIGEPRVGDVVVLNRPGGDDVLVKRVVATARQRVEIRDGVLFVDRRPRRESYVDYAMVDGFFFSPVRVPPDAVFVLGDQRGDSEDSRDFGAVPLARLIGRVDARVWPLSEVGAL